LLSLCEQEVENLNPSCM